MQHEVFISYSSHDREVAEAAREALEQEAITCWMAPRDILPGMSYAQSIMEAIRHTRLMVLIFSAHSNRSSQVVREVERTTSLDTPVLPFRIDHTVPTADMEYHLSARHWLDAFDGPSPSSLQRLVNAVRASLAAAPQMPAGRTDADAGPGPVARTADTLGQDAAVHAVGGGAGAVSAPVSAEPPVAPVPAAPTSVLAGLGSRTLAFGIDAVAIAALAVVVVFVLFLGVGLSIDPTLSDEAFDQRVAELEPTLWLVALVVGCGVYEVVANKRSTSVGKKLCNLRIAWPAGRPPTWAQAIGRGALASFAVLTVVGGLVAVTMMASDPYRRGWHDRLVGTIVVRD